MSCTTSLRQRTASIRSQPGLTTHLGTRNSASNESISNEISMISGVSLLMKPMIPRKPQISYSVMT